MPVGRTARQTGNLQAHDHAHVAQSDLRHQALEAISVDSGGSRQAQVLIDHDDLFARPPQGLCPPLQIVLPCRALAVLVDLAQCGLAR